MFSEWRCAAWMKDTQVVSPTCANRRANTGDAGAIAVRAVAEDYHQATSRTTWPAPFTEQSTIKSGHSKRRLGLGAALHAATPFEKSSLMEVECSPLMLNAVFTKATLTFPQRDADNRWARIDAGWFLIGRIRAGAKSIETAIFHPSPWKR
jgi:hypothetical protein